MLEQLRDRIAGDADEDESDFALSGLHWLTAGLFLAVGAESAFGERRGDQRASHAVRWAPLLAAPLAGAAHAVRAIWPSPATRMLARVADGVALTVGTAGLASSLYSARRENETSAHQQLPSFAPLAFAAVGVLGMMLDEEEEQVEDVQRSLERRARVVERLVPKRKARLDRIVVHV
jgi:hypothetical protein